MTILATTEITDCEFVCGKKVSIDGVIDKCIAIAGVVGDSDLTVMTYCVPTAPGVGVRKSNNQVWIAEGTLEIINSIIDIMFVDFRRGEGLVLISEIDKSDPTWDAGSTMRTRLDFIWKGDAPWVKWGTQMAISEEKLVEKIGVPSDRRFVLHDIKAIQVSHPKHPNSNPKHHLKRLAGYAIITRSSAFRGNQRQGDIRRLHQPRRLQLGIRARIHPGCHLQPMWGRE